MTQSVADPAAEALLPCPFCGSDEVSHGYTYGGGIEIGNAECHACDAAIAGDDEADAIRKWNRRAATEQNIGLVADKPEIANTIDRIEAWMRRAMRFVDLCDADAGGYDDLHDEAEHLLTVGFSICGFDPDGPFSASIENININPLPLRDLVSAADHGAGSRSSDGSGALKTAPIEPIEAMLDAAFPASDRHWDETEQAGEPCLFVECPPGLFRFVGLLYFKSEYSSKPGQPDAYCVDSGEYFWGGTNGDLAARCALIVTPITVPEKHAPASDRVAERCSYCDGSGDVIRIDGEWLGECPCKASAASDRLALVEAVKALETDFRRRAYQCLTNPDAFDSSAAAIWNWAADAVREKLPC